jgi:hypothetical protein
LWTNYLCISLKHILVHLRLSLNYQNQTRTFHLGEHGTRGGGGSGGRAGAASRGEPTTPVRSQREHTAAVRVRRRGCDGVVLRMKTTEQRKVRAESFFSNASWVRVLGRLDGHRDLRIGASERSDACFLALPFTFTRR